MAKLYGLSNEIMNELAIKLMTHDEFSKFVYHKDKCNEDILSLPELEDPIGLLNKKQVFINRRSPIVLNESNVVAFIYIKRIRNDSAKSKKIKTIWVNVGFLVHMDCSTTLNGNREAALLSAIEDCLDNNKFNKGLGICEVEDSIPINGLPIEWSGYDVICKIDGFTEDGSRIKENSL